MIDIDLEFEVDETEDDLEFDAQDYVGLSAYQIAVKHGYKGTEEQWIAAVSKTKMSQLQNDGDGESPFATEKYVNEHNSTGGTTNYNDLANKPKINGVELTGEVEFVVPRSTSELNNDGDGSGSSFATEKYVQEHQSSGSDISKTSQLVNDGDGKSPFTTETDVKEAIAAIPAPEVPTKTSELQNDGDGKSSFATKQDVADATKDKLTIVTNTTTTTKAYIAKTDSSQGTIDVATGAAANTLAQRGAGGVLKVGEAAADNDAVNLAYAKAHYVAIGTMSKACYNRDSNGKEGMIAYSNNNTPWTLIQRSEKGVARVGTPVGANDATTKDYVDSNITEQVNIAKDNLQYQLNSIMTFLRSTIVTETTVEDSYSTRTTAQGLAIIDGAATTLIKIAGKTESATNFLDISNGDQIMNGTIAIEYTPASNTVSIHGTPSTEQTIKVGRCYLRQGTYTLYIPEHNTSTGVDWSIVNSTDAAKATMNNTIQSNAISFEITEDGTYYLAAKLKVVEIALVAQVAILPDDKTSDLPPVFPVYYEGFNNAFFQDITSKDAANTKTSNLVLHNHQREIELSIYDYIDFTTETPSIVVYGKALHSDTPYTTAQLQAYTQYMVDASGKYLYIKNTTPTTTLNPYFATTYVAYKEGTETINNGGHDLYPTITQIYYEEVTSNQ